MTLTIDDVAAWQPDQLTTAGTNAQTISTGLDTAIRTATDETAVLGTDKVWSGAAAEAADTRMGTEKTRASEVSRALLELHTAFTSQVGNLNEAKSKVLSLRETARSGGQCWADQGKHEPGFEVAANGDVNADARIQWYRDNLSEYEATRLSDQARLDAANWHTDIVNALAQAENVANEAKTNVQNAVAALQRAYDGLGDPNAVATPAPTTPAAAAPVASYSPSSGSSNKPNYAMGNNGGNGSGSHSGAPSSNGSTYNSTGPMPTGDVAEWIKQAKAKLIEMGYSPDEIDERALAMIIQHESSGNPLIVNGWDSNASAGHPSKGLMQTIDSTFDAYKAPGHDNIFDPVDNIIAGTRYAIDRYGSLSNVPGVAAVNSGGAYQGY
ncbi:transglycosylase SLT domain-containing protein [Nocardia sp. NPDC005366]|uniref:transglycosylase SLT domain-containing protein n=1 Tax=Nocardia sp. NPDC005366 TaxID=3156878 RepID=UPI0033ADFEC7